MTSTLHTICICSTHHTAHHTAHTHTHIHIVNIPIMNRLQRNTELLRVRQL